ncbi:MAG: hypothetical protein SFU27_07600 [Thermonemataceae bacterium]|nr:hypothetical protein [Thermonemataceae bacterium]
MDSILPVPKGFEVQENSQGMVIRYAWYKPVAWFFIVFLAFWFGFIIFWFSLPTPWFFKAFALIHVAVGVGLAWYTLCLFKNKTEIIISPQTFAYRHTPIPFPTYKDAQHQRGDIEQVFVRQTIVKTKNGTNIAYQLHKIASEATKTTKMLSFESYDKAFFLKRKIEKIMRIEPRSIEGEYKPQ